MELRHTAMRLAPKLALEPQDLGSACLCRCLVDRGQWCVAANCIKPWLTECHLSAIMCRPSQTLRDLCWLQHAAP